MTTDRPARLPLRRPTQGRWLGGVAAGLAAHLGVPVAAVRGVLAFLTLAGGAGAAAYVFWWVTVPTGDPRQAAADAGPAAFQRLAPRLRLSGSVSRMQTRDIVVGGALLAGAALLVAVRAGWDPQTWVLPVLIALGGFALAWSQLDAAQRGRWAGMGRGSRGSAVLLRLTGGLVLVMAGVLLLLAQGTSARVMVQVAVASLAVLAGVALVLAPWWLRMVRELGDERAARAREAERADIAAHLHDSVLQTLALIRTRAADADEVARMARAQERELREWLYDDRTAPGTSLAAELRALVGEVEDGRAAAVDVVVVGDCVPTEATTALLQATREALVNAVVHGRPPVTVYMEVTDGAAEVFVRDRGDGFRMEDIAPDRFGVRESILGRMRRRGGTAEVTSRPGWGTEVRLRMPRDAEPAPDTPPEPEDEPAAAPQTSDHDEGART
ncbi:ATP-binding protein [Isoptericola variabilis]|uniref:Putative signal transduction histidine kinase n=1 Tax=Isoptericola variabilis (strain 225) TaxID=743718 RepID=F6FWW0_ISOV2|nr:ATP-binding protein [Isoptericola variabilis]AEG43532.1 putative signal transduction histidine kinase [Isoptericola variabilis 225]TWH32101.1 phage shock protein C (PspC) family protein [Isoptericola variabilis J7]